MGWFGAFLNKLPFDRAIFWKVFLIVMTLVVLTFYLLFKFSTYQLTNADCFGSLLSATIFSYLVHLWLLPPEYDDEEYEDEDEPAASDDNRPDETSPESDKAQDSPTANGE
ncbi:MAG: hypothetical protein IIB57_13890 [Planctomycetes bacterium]|nr:hypothetical protein [Planctomycetota bacterium]